jgi:hypothetical protein
MKINLNVANICYDRLAGDAGGFTGKPPHCAAGCFPKRLVAAPLGAIHGVSITEPDFTPGEVLINLFNVNRTRITSR